MLRRLRTLLLASGLLAACPAGASASMVSEFPGGLTPGFSAGTTPAQIATGPDGNLWFTEFGPPGRIASMDHAGVVHELTGGLTRGFSANANPLAITAGADGNVWFTEIADPGRIAYVDRDGHVHEFTGGQTPGFSRGAFPAAITTGPDGHMWFTEGAGAGGIAYVDSNGVVHEFTGGHTRGFSPEGVPAGITSGPDGHIWFTEAANPGRIAYIDGIGVVHELTGGQTPGFSANGAPGAVTTGPDGHVWFLETRAPGRIAYIDGNGSVHELTGGQAPGFTAGPGLQALATGSDGNLWFTRYAGPAAVGRVNFTDAVANGSVTEFPAAATPGLDSDAVPDWITTGPDGNLWFTDQGGPGRLGRVNGPEATTDAPTTTGARSATLNATVTPNGEPVSDCDFDFGPTTAYGTGIACTPAVGDGTAPVAVSAGVGGLLPGATYHYRAVAKNVFGIGSGSDRAFTMPALAPTAGSGPATRAGRRSASLSGAVDPNGANVTACRFDYGTSTTYGSAVPCAQQVGAGNGTVQVTAGLPALALNTTYHFRLVAANAAGTSQGADATFRLAQAPALSHLRLRPTRFPARRHTTISYRDSVRATTTFTIKRCAKPRPHRRTRCTLVETMSHRDRAGANRLQLSGRAVGTPLAPGRYTLAAVAAAGGMRSRATTARFEITTQGRGR